MRLKTGFLTYLFFIICNLSFFSQASFGAMLNGKNADELITTLLDNGIIQDNQHLGGLYLVLNRITCDSKGSRCFITVDDHSIGLNAIDSKTVYLLLMSQWMSGHSRMTRLLSNSYNVYAEEIRCVTPGFGSVTTHCTFKGPFLIRKRS